MVLFNHNKFFNTKIKKFKVDKSVDPADVKEDFKLIDNFKSKISNYLYNKIKIGDEKDWDVFTQSRIQMFLSQTLLRSLFLKDGIVRALNTNNFPAFYALAKSFLEIPAQLGYLTFILYENKPDEEFRNALNKLMFGHKGGLTGKMGVDPLNVMTMFDKLDMVLQKMALSEASDSEQIKIIKSEKAMRTTYEDICNFGHPNYAAHLSVGGINKECYWVAKNPKRLESYKYELYGGFYMHHFTTAIGTILITASMIVRHPKANNFSKLNNPRLKI